MPAVITVMQLRLGHPRQERPDGQRRLGLPHEDAGRDVQRLGAARAHEAVHDHREQPHDELHDAEVVEHREQRGDEDDRRQHHEREDVRVLAALGPEHAGHDLRPHGRLAERAEHERRAAKAKPRTGDHAADGLERPSRPTLGLEDDQREDELQAEPPGHRAIVDRAARRRQAVGEARISARPATGWTRLAPAKPSAMLMTATTASPPSTVRSCCVHGWRARGSRLDHRVLFAPSLDLALASHQLSHVAQHGVAQGRRRVCQ